MKTLGLVVLILATVLTYALPVLASVPGHHSRYHARVHHHHARGHYHHG